MKIVFTCCLALLVLASCQSTQSDSSAITPSFIQKPLDTTTLLAHFTALSSEKLMGRKTGTIGSQLTQEYLVEQLKRSAINSFNNHYRHDFIINKTIAKDLIATNIIGVIKANNKSDNYIVLSAHYDHLGAKKNDVYYGADDNASGSAVLLALAEQLNKNPLNHNVIILFTDAEELNLLGAKAFINQNPALVNKIVLNINLDMLAGSKQSNKLHFISKRLENILTEEKLQGLDRLRHSFSYKVTKGFGRGVGYYGSKRINWVQASDHGVFHRYSIPFIYFGVGTHKNYHTPKDTFENANIELLLNNANFIYQQLLYIDSSIRKL